MASLSSNSNGLRRILFHDIAGNRRCIYLGRMAKKAAEGVRDRIEELIACRVAGIAMTTELATWDRSLTDEFHQKLEQAGLVEPRATSATRTVGGLLDKFLDTQLVKPSTHKSYKQTLDSLREFLGADTLVRSVTPEKAAEWRKWIATQTQGVKKKRTTADNTLSHATVAKRINVARVVFNRAVEWNIITVSPFASLTPGTQVNEENEFQIPREWTQPILYACPGSKWRLVFGLARLAGLRIPSEIAGMTWADVNWATGSLTVNGEKTAHHGAGHGIRPVPICPELMELLEEHYEQAAEGTVEVFPDIAPTTNLGTTMKKIIIKAGLVPWVRLFDNCRASCENDWADEHPIHNVAEWMGHSVAVAQKHYLRAQDHHFNAVVAGAGGRRDADDDARATQNTTQHDPADDRTGSHASLEKAISQALLRSDAMPCDESSTVQVGDIGLEPMTPSLSS